LASSPKWRNFTKPAGSTWSRKRRIRLRPIELHDAAAVVMPGVPPAEAHLGVIEAEESSVGDGQPVCVAGRYFSTCSVHQTEAWSKPPTLFGARY
jgi:hypothetical protein